LELKHERPFLSYHYRYAVFSLFLLLDQFVLFFIFPYPQGEKKYELAASKQFCLSTNSLPNFSRELMSIIIQLFFFVWRKRDLREALVNVFGVIFLRSTPVLMSEMVIWFEFLGFHRLPIKLIR
jgi:hypothetical protein